MNAVRPRRSVLYMPGSNPRALDKARTLPADGLILDMEDAVAPEAKAEARVLIRQKLGEGGYGRREIFIRINGLGTVWGADDLAAAVAAGPDAILVPKVSSPDDLDRVSAAMDRLGARPAMRIWAMIETPLAILSIREIAAFATRPGSRLEGFVLGLNDLAKETGAQFTGDRLPMVPWIQIALTAARAYGLAILDGVYNDIHDDEGYAAECRQGREFGLDGKTLIHPRQIDVANRAFVPSVEEIEWAKRVVEVFALPDYAGKSAVKIEGRMVERLHADMAERTLALAAAIREVEAAA
ncbi:HpcH/HpaI aldolase/citrate lyase family protein [Methylobrevis pamukkalensis]|uniref:(3S)-malyl-CoA thioesterase n=1 Tax=Methylobrevis pamukkalensis TaxID=1439726 RepID=A0A1E3H7H8_9HYPH|nr:CoA ester lyase [Methylobrevis pamukkalensis]ODN72272.1 (3S)-malyl-CoA thioesterase [Methylobrevis pamukkalensis]